MDRIHAILEKHEEWIESLKPKGSDVTKAKHWDLILIHVEKNLTAREMISNVKQMANGTY